MIITITNQKGGVGKTVTAINLAAALAEMNRTVLVIDMDPQGHSTVCFMNSQDERDTLYQVFRKEIGIDKAIFTIAEEKVDIIPSGISLAKIERDLIAEVEGHFALKDIIEEVRGRYDYIIIDTPPALAMLTINSLVAADFVFIPIQASYLSLEGTEDLLDTIARVKSRLNPDLEIVGALITIHDKRTVLAKDVIARMKEIFREKLFDTTIGKSVRLEESPAYRESIIRYAPDSPSADEYRNVAREVVKRVE